MTNKFKSFLSVAIILFVANSVTTAQDDAEWKELNEFHSVMSQTFHPLEDGNYQPIRERSGEMVEKAMAWQNSSIPADYSNIKGIKKNLKQLVKKSSAMDEKIKANCTDEVIKSDLTALHDIFHEIIGLCTHEH
jgi:hypothetical protein